MRSLRWPRLSYEMPREGEPDRVVNETSSRCPRGAQHRGLLLDGRRQAGKTTMLTLAAAIPGGTQRVVSAEEAEAREFLERLGQIITDLEF
jgi:hypothetical protein